MNNINESGRSIVEILGVMALVGILSVTGVKGYMYAMSKYRANELLNEASKRATVLAAQIMAGREGPDLSIAEFPNNETGYGTFSLTQDAYPSGAKTFKMSLSSVSSDVCRQMKALTTGDSIMAIEGDCEADDEEEEEEGVALVLRFNKDLRRGVDDEEEEVSCGDNQHAEGNECVTNGSCAASVANCATCEANDSTKCASCNTGYRVLLGACVDNADCPIDHCLSDSCSYMPAIYIPETGTYSSASSSCGECEPGYYVSSDSTCVACPAHSWTDGDENHPVGKLGGALYDVCYCDEGYQVAGPNKACCPKGYYMDEITNPGVCIACPENSWTLWDTSHPVNTDGEVQEPDTRHQCYYLLNAT